MVGNYFFPLLSDLYMARSSDPPIIRYDPSDQSITNFTYPGSAQSISVDVYDNAIYWTNHNGNTDYEVMKTTYFGKTSKLNITYSQEIQVVTDVYNLYVLSKDNNYIYKYVKRFPEQGGNLLFRQEITDLLVGYGEFLFL